MTLPKDTPPREARFGPRDGLRLRHFDDDAVVFDPLSWDAHLLNPAAVAVLEFLQESPGTEADIAAFLVEALQADEQPQAAAHAKRLIEELLLLGLVRRTESSLASNR